MPCQSEFGIALNTDKRVRIANFGISNLLVEFVAILELHARTRQANSVWTDMLEARSGRCENILLRWLETLS